MLEIYGIQLYRLIDHSTFKRLIASVSKERRKKVQRLRRSKDAQRVLFSEVLIRYVLMKKLNLSNTELSFHINDYGKPFLVNRRDFYFNVSHSYDWVICAVHSAPVGIDVEMIRPLDYHNIAKRLFTKDEYNDLISKKDSIRLSYFFELWTLKESYIKAIGKGLCIPLNSFTIRVIGHNVKLATRNEFIAYHLKKYDIAGNYKVAVCAAEQEFPSALIVDQVDDVCKLVLR